jgi:hypothetical protein
MFNLNPAVDRSFSLIFQLGAMIHKDFLGRLNFIFLVGSLRAE